MAIEPRDDLVRLVSGLASLNDAERLEMINSAHFQNGRVVGPTDIV
jgi:hypothetical protein